MAFRGSLGNYMAVMLLPFNGIFRFSIYPTSLGGKSIKLFTFAAICPGLSRIHNGGKSRKGKVQDVSPDGAERRWQLKRNGTGWCVSKEWIEENDFLQDEFQARQQAGVTRQQEKPNTTQTETNMMGG